MLRSRTCALSATQGVVAVALFLFWAGRSAAVELSIIESGPESDASIGLRVAGLREDFPAVNRLVSPSGEVFTPDSILEEGLFSHLLIRFDSFSDAIDYVEGTWQATLGPPFFPPPDPPDTDTFEFSIEGLSSEAIDRTAPSLLTPFPGAVIKNGSTFNFGWDYVTSGETPDRTSITAIPLFDPISQGGRSIVGTPRPGSTIRTEGSGGVGDERFSRVLTNVPGTDENHWLLTLEAAEAALPLDVEITLGSYISLDDVVTLGDTSGLGLPFPPEVSVVYSRERDPFVVTLSTVPEPSSMALVIVLIIGGSFVRSRVAGRVGPHYRPLESKIP
jgi:hypothetical protein